MNLEALRAFEDNYIWMFHDAASAWVVDPGDAQPVHERLDALGLKLAGILVTHHHPDHIGGVNALRPRLQGPVYGPARERIPAPYTPVAEGDEVPCLGMRFTVMEVPGHTAGHVAYLCNPGGTPPLLFCGDTLFSAGCGRLFEGTPAQMWASLSRLAALPPDTRVCCTHEYTVSNLRFAQAVEPGNADTAAHAQWAHAQREAGLATLPSSMGQELKINPFLRCRTPAVAQAALHQGAASTEPVDVFTAIRAWKDRFR